MEAWALNHVSRAQRSTSLVVRCRPGIVPGSGVWNGPGHRSVIKPKANRCYPAAMNPWLTEAIGIAAALLTTFCWLPQVVKIVRERDTRAISFPANLASAIGVGCWLIYGAALPDWPLIGSSAITLAFMLVILALKLRHG
jgi:MtN3 and saliva related transmembrane protein